MENEDILKALKFYREMLKHVPHPYENLGGTFPKIREYENERYEKLINKFEKGVRICEL